jgi:predicted benzoate:H+ symporter BenE
MDIFVLAFVVWCLLRLFKSEPAQTIILVVGVVIALVGTVWVHYGHAVTIH